jgi:hypothetical protein
VPGTAEPAIPAVPVGTTGNGYLYGDLHTKGWAALATADTVVLTVFALKRPSVDGNRGSSPATAPDSSAPDAVDGAQRPDGGRRLPGMAEQIMGGDLTPAARSIGFESPSWLVMPWFMP